MALDTFDFDKDAGSGTGLPTTSLTDRCQTLSVTVLPQTSFRDARGIDLVLSSVAIRLSKEPYLFSIFSRESYMLKRFSKGNVICGMVLKGVLFLV